MKQLVDLGRLADRERDAERVREKRRERKMKYEKNGKDGDKGAGKVAVLGSSVEAADSHHGANSEDDDDGENDESVDEYGNNKYIKGAYEAHGDDKDDFRDPRIVNEYSDDDDDDDVVREPVKKTKANQKNTKRSRLEVEERDESYSDDDDAGQDADLKEQEEQVLKMLRTA